MAGFLSFGIGSRLRSGSDGADHHNAGGSGAFPRLGVLRLVRKMNVMISCGWRLCMRSTVSVRWQTVIPQEAREALKLEPNSKLEWEVKDGFLIVHPLPANPIRAARGMLKNGGPSVNDLLAERRRERER